RRPSRRRPRRPRDRPRSRVLDRPRPPARARPPAHQGRPRPQRPRHAGASPDRQEGQVVPVLYAHRGASAELPEDTLPAFLRALEAGATALETDAHLTRDGHVVLSHDPDGRRTAGDPRLLRRVTLAEARTWNLGRASASPVRILTLDELLEAIPSV